MVFVDHFIVLMIDLFGLGFDLGWLWFGWGFFGGWGGVATC